MGRRLLAELEARFRAGGVRRVLLETDAANTSASAFYERLGYRTVACLAGYHGPGLHAWKMEKALDGTARTAVASAMHPGLPAMWHAREEVMYQRLEEFLESRHATYETITHPGAVTAQEQAAIMHVPGRSVAKVLIVKERDGVVMAIVPAATDLDLDRFKGLIGHGDVRLASLEEIRAVVPDCPAGSIPPFGALYGLRAFIDRSLLGVPEVTMPAGDPGSAIRMRWSEFERIVDARPGDFAIPQSVMAAGGVAQPRRQGRRASSRPERT